MRRQGIAVTFLAAAIALAATPASAGAAETLGAVADAGGCAHGYTFLPAGVSSGPDYIADSSGVIVSYAMTTDSSTGNRYRLGVYKPAGGNNFITTQKDSIRTQAVPSSVQTFTDVHLPIDAGDTIGIYVPSDANTEWCLDFTGNSNDKYRQYAGDPAIGASTDFGAASSSIRLNLAGSLEPDGDKDTFGDETQDKCLSTPGAFGGCPSSVTLGAVKQKGNKPKIKVTVTVPGAGTLSAGSPGDPALAAAAKAESLKVTKQTLTATSPQTVQLTLKLTKSAKTKLADQGTLRVPVQVVYTPPGGPAASAKKKAKLRS